MEKKISHKKEEQKFQICKHCGKSFPQNVDTCPFCHRSVSAVENVGNKLAYVRIALIAAIIAAGFIAKCAHDHHKEKKAEQTEQVQKQAPQQDTKQ